HTFDYLIKPLTQEKMNQSLKRLTNYLGLQSRRFTFTFNRTSHSLDLTEIRYFEKNRHTVLIHTRHQIYETSMTTADVLAKLDHRFVQVHQSFIVNVNAVKHLKNQSLLLNDETIIPISRKYQRQAKIAIMAALREMMS
ncbi:MAG: LytR/AlgR family response regulator transcription factor, partial [Leuconostoc falkenbergense]